MSTQKASILVGYLDDARERTGADVVTLWLRSPGNGDPVAVVWSAASDGLQQAVPANRMAMVSWATQEHVVHCDDTNGAIHFAVASTGADTNPTGALSLWSTRGFVQPRGALKGMVGRFAEHVGELQTLLGTHQEYSRATRQTGILLAAAQRLPLHRTIEALGAAICEAALEMTAGRRAMLVRWDEHARSGTIAYATRSSILSAGASVTEGSHTGMACAGDVPLILEDATQRQGQLRVFNHTEPARAIGSLGIVPLRGDGGVIGALVVEGDAVGEVRSADAKSLRLLGHLAGASLDTFWRMVEIAREASTDSLTGLANRRYFDDRLRQLCSESDRFGSPVALVLMDIDHFKRVNDGYGHAAGDAVLRRVSAVLQDAVRTVDTCARYGGEELAILLPQTGLPGALALAERLRTLIEEQVVEVSGAWVRVTVSGGVACHPQAGGGPEGLVSAADRALYAAKQGGRNKVRSGFGTD